MTKRHLWILLIVTWLLIGAGGAVLYHRVDSAIETMRENRRFIDAAKTEYLKLLRDIREELKLIRSKLSSGEEREESQG